jgi:transcriptional regulator with XRE-family HTH domain
MVPSIGRMSDNALGDHLRARRELVSPEDVGLRVTGVRRTPGLRREEVATLAGISADYYLRLEQGRDRNPSPQVLEALARVFGLDEAATAYLLGLTGTAPTPSTRRGRPRRRETVPVGILQLLDSLDMPAFVENRRFDVLAANTMGTAMSPSIRAGENRMRTMFLEGTEAERYEGFREQAWGMVAAFRTSIGHDDDPETARLVGELSMGSEAFRQAWARHDVHALGGAAMRYLHPEVGALELRREKLAIPEAPGQLLVVHHAERGSATARALGLLGSIAATRLAEAAGAVGASDAAADAAGSVEPRERH